MEKQKKGHERRGSFDRDHERGKKERENKEVVLEKAKEDLFDRIRKQNLKGIASLLQRHPDLSVNVVLNENNFTETPLRLAVDIGNVEIVRFFLSKGADVNAILTGGKTAIHYAVQKGNITIVEELISHGANVNAENKFNERPVYFAVKNGDLPMVKYLVSRGADLSHMDWRLLRVAASHGHDKIAQWLLKKGAEINSLNSSDQMTALHFAAEGTNFALQKLLIENGADIKARNKGLATPLHYACSEPQNDALITLLIEKGADIEAKDDRGETPMHWAAGIGCKKAAQILYDHGAAINIPNLSGESPLYKAAGNGRADVASFLMENEANVNHVTKRGKTPLIEASHFGYTDIVEELLDHGADVTIIDKVQKTALYYAAAKGRERVVELLIVKGGADIKSLNQNMLRSAIDKHQMVIAMYLVDAGAVVDKHVTNSLEDMNNDRNSAEFAIRFAKAFKVKYAAALKDLHKLQQQVKEKNVLSPFVTNVYPKPDKDDEEIKQKFRPLFDRFYSRQELESASLFLGFVISKIAKVRREYHNAPNIETKRVKQEVLRSLCWSAKTILDVSLTVPDELMIPYRYLYKDESSKIEHQLEWELLSRPAYRNEELTLLSDIVAASIDILIQHAHVQRILQYKWKEEAVIPFTENLQLLKNNRIIRSVMYGRRILFVVNLLIFCTFVGIITTIALMSSNNNDGMMFQLNQKLQVSWSDAAVQQVQSKEDLYAWMSGPMIDGIESLKGRNQILSPVRLRQVRVKTHPCKLYEDITPDCYRSWSSDDEDTATFGTNKTFSYTESSGNMFSGLNSISYRDDGGFITEIDPAWNRTDLEEVVQDLENSDWIDENTAAVFVEFVVWTANLERFAVGRIMVETLKAGSFDTWTTFDLVDLQPYDGSAGKNLKALHIAFLFLCLYYIVSEVQQMIRFKRTYLRDRWNFFDMIVIAVFLVCIGLTVWVIFAKRSVNFDGSSNFPDFVWLVETENIQKSLIAFLAIIVWFNLLRYMRAFRDVGVLFRVMTKMAGDVAIFLTIFLVFVVSFALAFHMLVGSKIHEFRSWGYAIMTLIRVIVGDFEWEHIEESNLAFVRVLFFAYLVIVPILLINLLIAMLNKSYSDVVERAVSEYELEFASIVLGYGFERTRTGKKKKDPEDEIELNVLTGSTTSLLNSADSLKNSAEINQSGNLQKSDGLSQSTTGDASLDLETPHISRKGELNNSATTDVTDAHPMDEEKTELQEVLEALKLMKESNEALNEKIKSMKKEMEESLDAKFKELHVQITEMRKEVVKDEIDFVYSNSNLF